MIRAWEWEKKISRTEKELSDATIGSIRQAIRAMEQSYYFPTSFKQEAVEIIEETYNKLYEWHYTVADLRRQNQKTHMKYMNARGRAKRKRRVGKPLSVMEDKAIRMPFRKWRLEQGGAI